MPRILPPSIEPPESVRASIVVFQANSLRAEIIRDLAAHTEGSTTGDIGRRMDVDYRLIHRHIKVLASFGVVESSESAPGTGRHVIYTLDEAQLRERNSAFMDYLLGK